MPKENKYLYQAVKNILVSARNKAYRSVNDAMLIAYWQIGKRIVEEEQKGQRRAGYGEFLIEKLSERLSKEFGSGFSDKSLWNMRHFYKCFPILSALRRELSWTHYKSLIRVENERSRKFYEEESVNSNWSTRILDRQINSFYYERLFSSKNKQPVRKEMLAHIEKSSIQAQDVIKDPYVLEFLNLKSNYAYLEKDLEQALINQLQEFLLELGRGFSFVARQQRISTQNKEFYIDLVFYNYVLKCFVLVDLKVGELTHQDVGQMDMYVKLYEDKIKNKDDNPTIGIILCAEKDETIVKYSVLKNSKKLFASKYKLYLPSEKELIQELEREQQTLRYSLQK